MPANKKVNNSLPDQLKKGVEELSGLSMDDVKVHYNSTKPAQLQANAYAQETDIHLAPGQEKHLTYEAWQVVQQQQGRVQPAMQINNIMPINDNTELETEADKMGNKAIETSQQQNILELYREIDWLQAVIDQVIKTYLVQEGHENSWLDILPPDLSSSCSFYSRKVREWELNIFERLALALTLAPHIRPDALDIFFGKNHLYDRMFTGFGGVIDTDCSGFLPTGQTLCFLIASGDPGRLPEAFRIFSADSVPIKNEVLTLSKVEEHLPKTAGILSLSNKWFQYFLTGNYEETLPAFVKKITTTLNFDDLVVDSLIMEQLSEIITWINNGNTILTDWGLNKLLQSGYKALFYGPPGTGKTLAAALLGKATGREVYRVDLSTLVSKYIGETEKNLEELFAAAKHKNWILFFDEADALFGKTLNNEYDISRIAAVFLELLADYPGVVIVSASLKTSFADRFQNTIYFNMPDARQRLTLLKNAFSGTCTLHPDIDLPQIAEQYKLTGGAIINLLRHCALAAVKRGDSTVTEQELLKGIERELKK